MASTVCQSFERLSVRSITLSWKDGLRLKVSRRALEGTAVGKLFQHWDDVGYQEILTDPLPRGL